MKTFFQHLFFFILLLPLSSLAKPLIILDSGHTPEQGGALGLSGQYEVVYNDRFVAELAPALEKAGWQVKLTREQYDIISLDDRAQLANENQAALLLSIHHDSVQMKHLRSVIINGNRVLQTRYPIRGYSIFVSKLNPQYQQSKTIASAIGNEFRAIGRPFASHHAEKIMGENRLFTDSINGVYRHDHLAVLRKTTVPAVLLELGVIVDPEDEYYVNQPENRRAMIIAIVRGLNPYLQSLQTASPKYSCRLKNQYLNDGSLNEISDSRFTRTRFNCTNN